MNVWQSYCFQIQLSHSTPHVNTTSTLKVSTCSTILVVYILWQDPLFTSLIVHFTDRTIIQLKFGPVFHCSRWYQRQVCKLDRYQ